jgi:hypothetical protein
VRLFLAAISRSSKAQRLARLADARAAQFDSKNFQAYLKAFE